MSIATLDSQTERRARARAQAAAIADSPRVARRYTALRGAELRRSPRRRSSARRAAPPTPAAARRGHSRRWIAAAVLLLEVTALILALTLPVLRVRTITVRGNRLMSSATLLRAADVPATSIFTVDGSALRLRLLTLPWVEDATVTTDLPGTVHLDVVERPPVLRVRRGDVDSLVAANGATLSARSAGAAELHSMPVLLDDRVGSPAPLDTSLVQTLSLAAARFPAVFGCGVAAFQWGSDDMFAVWTSCGWRAILGHVDTDAEIAGIPAQLSALASLKAQLSFTHPAFGYVDLDNAGAPAVGGAPGLPAEILSATQSSLSAGADGSTVAPPVAYPPPLPSSQPGASPSPAAAANAAPAT